MLSDKDIPARKGDYCPDLTTTDVLETLHSSGKPLHEWGRAIDGTPLLAARTGGEKKPAIFITAGSHSPETAGVHAALRLLQMLDTEHEVHILPLRDPLGFGGVNHCLSFATGQPVKTPTHDAALDYLSTNGQLLWHEEEMRVFQLGDLGFIWEKPMPCYDSFLRIHPRMISLTRQEPDQLKPLWGKRVMLICSMIGLEGNDKMQRCWHGVLTSKGEWRHLNRLFGRADAPSEVATLQRLMDTVRPGLTWDLHEGADEGFWLPIPEPKKELERNRVFEMSKAYLDYIHCRGYPITTYEEWLFKYEGFGRNYPPGYVRPEPRLPGLFWSHVLETGEGHNLSSYADLLGDSLGTESPVVIPLAMRVDGLVNGILASLKVWEQAVADF